MENKDPPASQKPETKKEQVITFISEKYMNKLAKEKSNFARWCEREELRLANQQGGKEEFDKAYKLFERERDKKRRALWILAQKVEKERRRKGYFWDWPWQEGEHNVSAPMKWIPSNFPRPTFFTDTELSPYEGNVQAFWPCPDYRQWSAWNDCLGAHCSPFLSLNYRYWFPSDHQHPFLKQYFLSGRFIINSRLALRGVVDIGRDGYVIVHARTNIKVIECTADDKNHDNGLHCDPSYDTHFRPWSSDTDGNQQGIFSDTLRGLHTFAQCFDLPLSVIFSCGAPNRCVNISQDLSITAENAGYAFGPNRDDCAAMSDFGWIYTSWPHIQLEYVGPPPSEYVLYAH